MQFAHVCEKKKRMRYSSVCSGRFKFLLKKQLVEICRWFIDGVAGSKTVSSSHFVFVWLAMILTELIIIDSHRWQKRKIPQRTTQHAAARFIPFFVRLLDSQFCPNQMWVMHHRYTSPFNSASVEKWSFLSFYVPNKIGNKRVVYAGPHMRGSRAPHWFAIVGESTFMALFLTI